MERARYELAVLGSQPRGQFALGTSPTLGSVLMPLVVEQALVEFPALQLRVVESRSVKLHEALLTGELDLAILTNPVGSQSLNLQPLLTESLCLIEKAGTRAPGSTIRLEALAAIPVVVTAGNRAMARGDFSSRKINLTVAAEIDSIETIRCLVRSGHGRTITPASTFSEEIRAGVMSAHPIDAPDRQRTLVLASRTDNAQLPAVREISRIVRTEVQRQIVGPATEPAGSPDPRAATSPASRQTGRSAGPAESAASSQMAP